MTKAISREELLSLFKSQGLIYLDTTRCYARLLSQAYRDAVHVTAVKQLDYDTAQWLPTEKEDADASENSQDSQV